MAISTTLVWLVYRVQNELPFHWIMIAFAILIVACDATHFMEVWTLTAENPRSWLSGWVKLITAIASVTTAVVLPPLIPHILSMLSMLKAARLSAEQGVKLERAYGELNDLYKKVTQLDQLKTNFFANVSHELRTPLALIFAPVEHLLQTAKDPAARRELTVVRRNALLLHKYVNDLLDVSKLEVGRLDLHYSRIDLAAMARAMANIFESIVSERGISVALQGPAEVVAEVDGDKVQRVFMNLLSNAFKYAPDDSTVSLSLTEYGDQLSLTVEDSGPGVPPHFRETIFERFQQGQAATTRHFGGLGLGLTVAKGLVEAHGGTISVRSAGHKQGATLIVELPVITAGSVPENAPATPSFSSDAPARSLRVLLVEDHDDTRHVLHRLMTRWNHTVTVASTLAEARKALAEGTFDLLLSDIGLPDGSGYKVIAMLREHSDIPAIAMSGYGMEADIARVHAAGFTEHIVKPVTAEALRKMLYRFSTQSET
ncbi:ATP-binding protein [Prosthecobacter sp.]|uniref:hybrid sensor histidine kinase/response regulator n=1 Tax=Prosthecobacter sp. TaxID=1965333 RepID=UPI0037C88B90